MKTNNKAEQMRMDNWQRSQANSCKLNSCAHHEFLPILPGTTPGQPSHFWECRHCGGTVSDEAKYWYEKGVEHASGTYW